MNIRILILSLFFLPSFSFAQETSPKFKSEFDEVKQISIAGLDISKKVTHAQATKIFGQAKVDEVEVGEGDKDAYYALIVPYEKQPILPNPIKRHVSKQ